MRLQKNDLWFGIQICVICIFWWTSSSGQSIINKIVLQRYPYPLTIALSSCLNNVLYAIPLIKLLAIVPVNIPTEYLIRTVIPISIGRAAAVTSAYFALWKISVSYAQTVKSTMPLFTVFLSRVLLNEHQPLRVYFSLAPIVVGVFIATATELQFDTIGLCSSLFSTGIFAFLNVLAKKVFEETGMHPINLLSLNSQLAALLLFPFWILTDAWKMWSNMSSANFNKQQQSPDAHFLFLLVLTGFCSFLQNLCAFALIHQLTTLSYSVTNTAKRIFVILLSLATLKNPVTPLNFCGMLLSIMGVLFYNRMKSRGGEHSLKLNGLELFRRREPVVGMHSSGSDVQLLLASN